MVCMASLVRISGEMPNVYGTLTTLKCILCSIPFFYYACLENCRFHVYLQEVAVGAYDAWRTNSSGMPSVTVFTVSHPAYPYANLRERLQFSRSSRDLSPRVLWY